MNFQIINGNNIEVLKQYPDNHFDAVVTDPPYGLGKEPNAEQMLRAWIDTGFLEVSGSGFMGKEWDAFVPQPLFWKEVFRVLKPGGHILSFFGTRTYDWGVMAMRLAGFEVRDCIQWVYGSGFPKSYNVAKGIEGKIVNGSASWNDWKILDGEKEQVNWGYSKGQAEQGYRDDYTEANKERVGKVNFQSKEAKQWDGWGSALKPANEPIVLARKPLEKGLSIAENVLKWGTGGINIDGCRISTTEQITNHSRSAESSISKGKYGNSSEQETHQTEGQKLGRFPANLIMSHHPECECIGIKKVGSGKEGGYNYEGNVYDVDGFINKNSPNANSNYGIESAEDWNCHDDCPIKIMDEQSGTLNKQGVSKTDDKSGWQNKYVGGDDVKSVERKLYLDTGGASRFFYCAKASKSERNKGLNSERWFYNLELITDCCSFTEQNLFIWENEEQNQNTDLNLEVQQKKGISEGIVSIANDKECCTTLNGKNIMAVFPKAIKFTTKTGLNQTIELKTSNYYQHLNISDCIADVLETSKENGLNLAENVGIKNLLKLLFTKDKTGFPLGVKIVANKMPQLISVKDAWKKSNTHSTVKPIKLMQYLARLITPPNGLVLDPFCGSGTTGIACKLEGFNFVGIEQDAEYCKISEARISAWNEIEEYEDFKSTTKVDDINEQEVKPNNNNDKQYTLF